MKRAFIVMSVFCLSLAPFVHSGWAAESPPRDRAVFYQGYCGEGKHLDLSVGEYPDLRTYALGPAGGTWNDQITCIAMGSGITKVIVYEDINYKGRSKEFTRSSWGSSSGNWTLDGGSWNDRISSIKVIGSGYSNPWGGSAPRDEAVFYQDGCGSGGYLELRAGEYADLRNYTSGLSGGTTWNDQITCIAIGSGITKVIVYEDINYKGRSKEFTGSSWGTARGNSSLEGSWWNDRISSIKVVGPGYSNPWGGSAPHDEAVFYQDNCGSGSYLELRAGEYRDLRSYTSGLSNGSTWNDQITCITIGSDISKVIVYEDINFEGRSKEFTGSSWGSSRGNSSLRDDWWNDRISSIKVIGPGYSSPWGGSPGNGEAVFYQDGCGSGTYLELGRGEYPDMRDYTSGLAGGDTWNDRITCITVGSGVSRVIVYEDVNFQGRSKEFTRSSWSNPNGNWSLDGDWWNDRISSIRVQ